MTAPAAPATGSYFTLLLDQAKEDLARQGKEIFDFGVGDPIEPTAPFIRQALIDAVDPVSQYPTVYGQKGLREAIAGWAQRRLGVSLDPSTQVIPAAGSKESIFHLPLAVLGPDEKRRGVIYPTPCYPVYDSGTLYARGVQHPIALQASNGYKLDLGSLPKSMLESSRIAWINYPHNPTGAGVDLAYLQEQVEVAREYDILLCADDCYLDLYFDETKPPPSVLQVTTTGVMSFGSLSKRSGMTGYRSGYIAGDAGIISILRKARPNFGVGSQNFVQAAATKAWADDAHVAERRGIFRAKRDLIVNFLVRKGYEVTGSEGAIYVWAKVPTADPQIFFKRMLDAGVVIAPGESFGNGGEGYFRVALVPVLDQIERALAVWDQITF